MMKNGRAAHHLTLIASTPVDFRHTLMNISNDVMGVQNELGLERDKSAATKQRHVEHTLKT